MEPAGEVMCYLGQATSQPINKAFVGLLSLKNCMATLCGLVSPGLESRNTRNAEAEYVAFLCLLTAAHVHSRINDRGRPRAYFFKL